jgi:hypothetical protein
LFLDVYDVNNASGPVALGSFDLGQVIPDSVNAFRVIGHYAYIYLATGLAVIDVGDPLDMRLVSSSITRGSADSATVSGDYAYVITTFGLGNAEVSLDVVKLW